jgi:hypothetical protein
MLQVATMKIEDCCATVTSLRPTRLPAELEEKRLEVILLSCFLEL